MAGIDRACVSSSGAQAADVVGCVPKIGESGRVGAPGREAGSTAPDEQEMGITVRRLRRPRDTVPQGPQPYLPGWHRARGAACRWIRREGVRAQPQLLPYAERFGLAEEKMRRIETVTDELILNAIYNAPRDERGQAKYAGLDRRTAVTLGAQAQVRLRWGSDGRTFASRGRSLRRAHPGHVADPPRARCSTRARRASQARQSRQSPALGLLLSSSIVPANRCGPRLEGPLHRDRPRSSISPAPTAQSISRGSSLRSTFSFLLEFNISSVQSRKRST